MIRVGILGCGNIAGIIASQGGTLIDIAGCCDTDAARSETFAQRVSAASCPNIDALLGIDFPLLVEAASIAAVRDHLQDVLARGKDAVVLSVGALADPVFLRDVKRTAAENGHRIFVPSGAVFGLDNLKVSRICGVDRLMLRTTKPPRALGLESDTRRTCLFRGSAAEAVQRFPRNINVSASVGLAAGVDPEVELWVDPSVSSNRHEIEASGVFGSVSIKADNLPSPDNPATSYLAALSVLTLLKDLDDPLVVGT
jgi:aspartate dehydrogenase